jgi:PKD repeat protein
MRSIPLLAVSTVVLAAAWACGGGSDVGPNTPPVAAFTAPSCTKNTSCAFVDASTDADGSISSRTWDFGDPTSSTNTSTDANPSHTFATAGIFQVKLTVTDNAGATGTVTNPVTVGVPPTASFVSPSCTAGAACAFSSTSADADGSILTTHWEFGEPTSPSNTADGVDATHTYAAAGSYNVTLTVTDNDGLTGTVTQPVTVAASQDCTVSGLASTCTLNIATKSTVTVTIVSNQCELGGSRFDILSHNQQNVTYNGCLASEKGRVITLNGTNQDKTYDAGAALVAKFTPGTAGPTDPIPGPSLIRVEGSFPKWTLHIDDGGAPALPRNDDIVLLVEAK